MNNHELKILTNKIESRSASEDEKQVFLYEIKERKLISQILYDEYFDSNPKRSDHIICLGFVIAKIYLLAREKIYLSGKI